MYPKMEWLPLLLLLLHFPPLSCQEAKHFTHFLLPSLGRFSGDSNSSYKFALDLCTHGALSLQVCVCLLSLALLYPMAAPPLPFPCGITALQPEKCISPLLHSQIFLPLKDIFVGSLCKEYPLGIYLLLYPRSQDHQDWQKEEVERCSLRPLDHCLPNYHHPLWTDSEPCNMKQDMGRNFSPHLTCIRCHHDI